MKTLTISSVLAAALFLSPSLGIAGEVDLAGIWRGDIDPEGQALELVFHIASDGEGGWGGTVDTPAQNSYGLPLRAVTVSDEGDVTIVVAITGGLYEARLEEGNKQMKGVWKQRGAQLPLNCAHEAAAPEMPAEIATALEGIWEGVLDVGALQLRLVITLEAREGGDLGGHMVSPDQSADQIPVTRVDFLEATKVRIAIGAVGASFEVALSEDGEKLEGKFRQGVGVFDIALEKTEKATQVRRPQEPKPPYPYRVEEVSYSNDAAEVTFAGTLTLPQEGGPFPAALLITGSGGQDRDEALFGHKPFHVIADHLTRAGIAVLRVDDRGVGGTTPGKDVKDATTLDFVEDVLCGVTFLASRPEIDSSKIGLIGHSEGGVIAPLAAVRSEEVAFIVMLAGTGIPGDQLLQQQGRLIGEVSGLEEEELETDLALQKRLFRLLLDDALDDEQLREKLAVLMRESPSLSEGEEGESEIEMAVAQLMTPWIRWFLAYDPAPTLEKVRCPVLALNGTLDLQVPCRENLGAIEAALKKGKNSDYTIKELVLLNHLFQHAKTGAPSEYGKIEETFATEALELMSNWINERFQGASEGS